MKNKFNIEFLMPCYGWQGIYFKNNNQTQLYVGASFVFSPYYDYVDTLLLLNNKKYLPLHFKQNRHFYGDNTLLKLRKREVSLVIDREGYDSIITFKPQGKKIIISTKTCKGSKKASELAGGKPRKIVYQKKQVLKEMKHSVLKYEKQLHKNFKKDFEDYKTFRKNDNYEEYYNDQVVDLSIGKYLMKKLKKIRL